MDEHADCALHYGHIGRAIYHPETRSWTFSRSLARSDSITYTGVTNTTVSPPLIRLSESKTFGPYGQPPDPKLIPHAHPHLAVHWSSIHENEFSRFVTDANEISDPHVSTLLDIGYAVDPGYDDAKLRPSPIPIAAVVTGECRNTISFRVLVEDTVELTNEKLSFRVPAIGDTETTEWSTQGARVRQICFAQPMEEDEEKGTWMAARLSESITVFRPLYHREPAPVHLHYDDPAMHSIPLQNSRLDANPAVEILSSYTGGFPYADVAFNPCIHNS